MNWLWLAPAVPVVGGSVMLVILFRDWLRRLSCPHKSVRLVRQQRGELVYLAEVCMDCQKTFADRFSHPALPAQPCEAGEPPAWADAKGGCSWACRLGPKCPIVNSDQKASRARP